MQDFIIQILATLVSTLVIFIISQLIKLLKKVPNSFWYNLLYNLGLVIIYLFDVSNLILIISSYSGFSFSFKYIIYLIALSFCLYTTIDLASFIKKEFSNYKFNKQK